MDGSKDAHFFERVYEIVRSIPYGKVMSYGQIAAAIGQPHAARSVGWAMSCCPDDLPWQRVVRADGSVAGGAYAQLRRKLLTEEGINFLCDGRVDMQSHTWMP
ncbi:MAG: methylated-DNA--[protein]-cysteine S-methyltransferase [Coriobacteriia bacterium]|nr:methylated-DNA--[protein]-cysteine S-methyltransferase [Coriobacteriia bacterium]